MTTTEPSMLGESPPASPAGQEATPRLPPAPFHVWPDLLPTLELTTLEVDVHVRAPVHLADPACAVIRGLLGERLRDFRCLTRAPTCEGCSEAAACDYARIFGGEVEGLALPGRARGLHPYWLQGIPPTPGLDTGAHFTARLVAVGHATPVLPYLDIALRDALGRLGAHPRDRSPELSASRIQREPWHVPAPSEDAQRWRVEALTPLVLRGDLDACANACPRAPWLALLVRAGVRRLGALAHAFGSEPAPWAEMPALGEVRVVEGAVARWHGSRMSRRQGQRFPIDGLVGSAVVEGPAMPVVGRLLRMLARTSVGKATTMGFGVLAATPVP